MLAIVRSLSADLSRMSQPQKFVIVALIVTATSSIGRSQIADNNSQSDDCMLRQFYHNTSADESRLSEDAPIFLGRCTPIRKCEPLMKVLRNAERPLNPSLSNYLKSLHCEGFENGLPIVCCSLTGQQIVTDNPDSQKSTNTTEPPPKVDVRGSESSGEQANGTVSITVHPKIKLLPLNECGPVLTQKISNGNATDLFEYPWMALLAYDSPTDGGQRRFRCGGSLINNRYVLTAAHCVIGLQGGARLASVRLGEYDTTSETDCQTIDGETECAEPVQDIDVEEVISHSGYNQPRYSNDIALIRLAREVNMQPESVRPVCLPATDAMIGFLPKLVTVTGWGTTENQTVSARLLQASVPVVPNDSCQLLYRTRVVLQPTQMCAGGELGIDSCRGDSGGPLVYPAHVRTTQMVQFGIVSLGVATCSSETHTPGIYTRVVPYMKWILDNMRK